jgi:hypothetical protein
MHPILGSIGFVLVAFFIYEVICKSAGMKPIFGISAWLSSLINLNENDTRRIITILAVSWDALWCGPANAAQIKAGHWNNFEVFGSFIIVGLVVAMVAQVALISAFLLKEKKFSDVKQMVRWGFNGKIVELSVIGGFGVLSLLSGFGISENIWLSILIAGSIVYSWFQVLKMNILTAEIQAAENMVFADEVPTSCK